MYKVYRLCFGSICNVDDVALCRTEEDAAKLVSFLEKVNIDENCSYDYNELVN